jgi:hypothetical protein
VAGDYGKLFYDVSLKMKAKKTGKSEIAAKEEAPEGEGTAIPEGTAPVDFDVTRALNAKNKAPIPGVPEGFDASEALKRTEHREK